MREIYVGDFVDKRLVLGDLRWPSKGRHVEERGLLAFTCGTSFYHMLLRSLIVSKGCGTQNLPPWIRPDIFSILCVLGLLSFCGILIFEKAAP